MCLQFQRLLSHRYIDVVGLAMGGEEARGSVCSSACRWFYGFITTWGVSRPCGAAHFVGYCCFFHVPLGPRFLLLLPRVHQASSTTRAWAGCELLQERELVLGCQQHCVGAALIFEEMAVGWHGNWTLGIGFFLVLIFLLTTIMFVRIVHLPRGANEERRLLYRRLVRSM